MDANPSLVRTEIRAEATDAAREMNRKDCHGIPALCMERIREWLATGDTRDMGRAILVAQEMRRIATRL